METIKTILPQMPQISKPQLKFILELLLLIMCLRGRANFRNFSREDRQQSTKLGKVISIARGKIRKANEHLLERFSSYLGLDFSSIKSRPDFGTSCNYGAIAT
jgi:hypothetical protein